MFLDDRLDERKKLILKAIIDDYINTAEPIGSRTIARRHELGLSSATIRNEMADLEEMGFLAQPHTSAGRIPSDKGYRMYVDQLMRASELTVDEIESIKSALEIKINEMCQLIRQASAVLSRITRYTSIATTPTLKKVSLKAAQVVPIEAGKALIVVVTNAGVVRNSIVKIPESTPPEFLIRVSNALNDKLTGLTLSEITVEFIKQVEKDIGIRSEILLPILYGVLDCIDDFETTEILTDGTTNIFNYPEFRDVMKARDFLSILDEKQMVSQLMNSFTGNNDINVRIGAENELDGIKDCTLVTATYRLSDNIIGTIGIIGPTRMEYSKVLSSIYYIRSKINQEILRLINDGPDGS